MTKGRSVSTAGAPQGRRRNGLVRFGRWLRYRFVVPIKRSRHPPQYTARGVAVGLFWAMTPTVGIQMMFVLANWLLIRRFAPRWDFNVIHAMAWTWVTNFATVLPSYYMFYVTGQLVLGRWDDLTGYEGFIKLWDAGTAGDRTTDYLPGAVSTPDVYYDVYRSRLGAGDAGGLPPLRGRGRMDRLCVVAQACGRAESAHRAQALRPRPEGSDADRPPLPGPRPGWREEAT